MRALLERCLEQRWTYHHWPAFQPREVYRDVEDEYLSRLQRLPGLRSVWRFGAIGVPGISDLDFLIVFDDRVSDALSHDMVTPQGLSSTGNYIIFHEPYIANQDLLAAWNRWGNGATLTHLYGDETPPTPPDPVEQKYVAAVTLNDLLTQLEPRLFLRTLLTGNMHVRATLCQINASRHLANLFKQIADISNTPWDSFFAEFGEFRRQWFALGQERVLRLKEYLIQAIIVLFELVQAVSETLLEQGWFSPQPEGTALYLAEKYLTAWVSPWSLEYAIEKALELWDYLRQVVLIFPMSVALPVLAYADSEGPISQYVRHHTSPSHMTSASWCTPFRHAAREHAKARNAHVGFLHRRGLWHLEANYFGLGLWPVYVSGNLLRKYPRRIYYMLRKQRYQHTLNQALSHTPR